VETELPPTSSRRTDKRGRFSTTEQQLHQRETQLDAEEEATGQPSITKRVYEVLRCPGAPCNLGPHCWVDPVTKKHYKLKWHHFKDILRLVEEGHHFETQNDMPEKVRLDLYAEEQQFLERRQNDKTSPSKVQPINIILPESFYQSAHPGPPSLRTPAPDASTTSPPCKHLDISGPRDELTDEYIAWQQSQVTGTEQKTAYQEACKVMKDHCLDLGLIYRNPNPQKLIDLGVKIGAAEHIVYDIDQWKQCRKRPRTEEYL